MMRAMLPTLQQPMRLSMAARNPQLRMIAGGSRAFQTTPRKTVAASSQGRKYPGSLRHFYKQQRTLGMASMDICQGEPMRSGRIWTEDRR